MFRLKFLSGLPLVVLHLLGSIAGCLVWLSSAAYRGHVRQNIRQAFPGQDIGPIVFGAVLNAGRTVFEIPRLWLGTQKRAVGLIRRQQGWEVAEAAQAQGKGLIFLTPHLGCFELVAQHVATRMPVTIMFRPPRQAWLEPIMKAGRGKENIEQAPTDVSGVRLMMRTLKRHGAIGLLPDQAPSAGDGRWLDFFDRPAYTMTLAARLSEMNTQVIFSFVRRLPWGQGFEILYRLPRTPLAGTTEQRAQQINHEIEALIRQCPDQSLWGYNRYKRPRGAEAPPEMAARTEN